MTSSRRTTATKSTKGRPNGLSLRAAPPTSPGAAAALRASCCYPLAEVDRSPRPSRSGPFGGRCAEGFPAAEDLPHDRGVFLPPKGNHPRSSPSARGRDGGCDRAVDHPAERTGNPSHPGQRGYALPRQRQPPGLPATTARQRGLCAACLQQPLRLSRNHRAGGARLLRVPPWGGYGGAKPFRDRGDCSPGTASTYSVDRQRRPLTAYAAPQAP